MTRLPRNPVPYLALVLVLAIGAGGGYAIAAGKTKTITVCADKGTGILHFKSRGGRCKRGQTRVTWNQQGPQGPQGFQGPAGAPAVSVWAQVATDGSVLFGQGLSVQHTGSGTYQVTITSSACANASNAPVVSLSDVPPNNLPAGAVPVAWFEGTGVNEQFTVVTGRYAAGSFTPSDHTFTVLDNCT